MYLRWTCKFKVVESKCKTQNIIEGGKRECTRANKRMQRRDRRAIKGLHACSKDFSYHGVEQVILAFVYLQWALKQNRAIVKYETELSGAKESKESAREQTNECKGELGEQSRVCMPCTKTFPITICAVPNETKPYHTMPNYTMPCHSLPYQTMPCVHQKFFPLLSALLGFSFNCTKTLVLSFHRPHHQLGLLLSFILSAADKCSY